MSYREKCEELYVKNEKLKKDYAEMKKKYYKLLAAFNNISVIVNKLEDSNGEEN